MMLEFIFKAKKVYEKEKQFGYMAATSFIGMAFIVPRSWSSNKAEKLHGSIIVMFVFGLIHFVLQLCSEQSKKSGDASDGEAGGEKESEPDSV